MDTNNDNNDDDDDVSDDDNSYKYSRLPPDNSNVQGKSKKVRVIGSSKKIAGSKQKKQFLLHSEHFNHI